MFEMRPPQQKEQKENALDKQNKVDKRVDAAMADMKKLHTIDPEIFSLMQNYRDRGCNEKTAPTAISGDLLERLRSKLGPHWRAVFTKFDSTFPRKERQ